MTTLHPETKTALRQIADQLQENFRALNMETFWGVKLFKCRAYVWALYRGQDPVIAIGRATYGQDLGLYDEDPTWCDQVKRTRSRTYSCEAFAAALDATLARLSIQIPQRSAA